MASQAAAGTPSVVRSTLVLSASTQSGVVGTSVTVHTKGGSGTGAVRFSVTGAKCSINVTKGTLSASGSATCVVTATKAASGKYKSAKSASLTVTFAAVGGIDNPTYLTPDKASLVTSSWSSTGWAGTGPVDDTTNGLNWFISTYYSPTDKWYHTYAAPGATITLSWIVTGSNGQRLAITPVTLQTQFAPGANNGKGDTDASFSAPSMVNGNISATTNNVGEVSFTFTTTNGSANAAPAGWNSKAVSFASGVAPKMTVADVAAETLEAGSGYSWTRMVLQVGSEKFTDDPANPNVTQATDLVDVIIATGL